MLLIFLSEWSRPWFPQGTLHCPRASFVISKVSEGFSLANKGTVLVYMCLFTQGPTHSKLNFWRSRKSHVEPGLRSSLFPGPRVFLTDISSGPGNGKKYDFCDWLIKTACVIKKKLYATTHWILLPDFILREKFTTSAILVSRGHDPFGQHQESRPQATHNTGSPRLTDSFKSDWLKTAERVLYACSKFMRGKRW